MDSDIVFVMLHSRSCTCYGWFETNFYVSRTERNRKLALEFIDKDPAISTVLPLNASASIRSFW